MATTLLGTQQISEILESAIPPLEWERKLGEAVDQTAIGIDHFDFDPGKIGKYMWRCFRADLYDYLCQESKPREWLNDLITGDGRNTVVGIVSAISARYEVTLAIAVPISALILKTGVLKYCSGKRPDKEDDFLFLSYLKSIKHSGKKKKKGKPKL